MSLGYNWPMLTQEFSLTSQNQEILRGDWFRPADDEQLRPTIGLFHGLALNRHHPSYDQMTELLVASGFNVFRVDLAGCGESGGLDREITVTKWANDIQTIFSYILKFPGVDKTRLGVIAHSLGAAATLVAQPSLKSLGLLAPTINFAQTMQNVFKAGYHPDGISVRYWSKTFKTELGPKFLPDAESYDLKKLIQKMAPAVLLVQGTTDNKVLPESTLPFFDQLQLPLKEKIVGEFDHLLNPNPAPVLAQIVAWEKKIFN